MDFNKQNPGRLIANSSQETMQTSIRYEEVYQKANLCQEGTPVN